MSANPLVSELSLLKALCENATVALFVMDERQHCVYMNRSAEQLTGYTLAEVQGQPLHNFVHHTHPDGTPYPLEECPIDRVAPQNYQEQGEEVFVHKDGHFYPVAFTASPIRQNGEVLGTVIEVQEISRRKQSEAERETLREVGQLILGELRLERVVQGITDIATRLVGAQFGAFFYNVMRPEGGSYMLYALSGVEREKFDRFPLPRATALFGPTFRGEGTIRKDDVRADPRYGTMPPHHGMPAGHLPVRSYLAVPVKLADGEVFGGLFFGHAEPGVFTADHERMVEAMAAQAAVGISKARLFEAAEAARDKAEAEAREKERLYHEATEASRMKDEFLATVSHELRTPLTSILGWTKMLASGRLPLEMQERAIATIDRNARAQAQIIEDLLDVSRITSGKLRLNVQLFRPAQAVEAAVEAVRPAAIAKDIRLQLLVDPQAGPISGDPDRLQQVVWNLVANAVKFTDKGGRVHVTLERVDSHVAISVRDTGRGIDPAFLPRMFDRFTQLDATATREHGGLGLGLAIVKQLVEMHGGSVQAESPGLGHGSVFTVRLPVAPLSASSAAEAERVHPRVATASVALDTGGAELQGARVLLVEDDNDARHLLATVLQSHGAQVDAAASAQEGLQAFATFAPTVVVSDIGMPGTDGYAFIRELRRQEVEARRPAVPAVALTAYARVEDRMRALSEGFQMHVAKPVEPAELVAVVATLKGWRPG